MINKKIHTSIDSLRLWPAVFIVGLQSLLWFVLPSIDSSLIYVGLVGSFGGGLFLILWWLFFSKAYWSERIGGLVLAVLSIIGVRFFLHESMATSGMGVTYFVYAVPTLCIAFLLWVMTCRRNANGPRWFSMAGAILLGSGLWVFIRTEGFNSTFNQDFSWRWSQSSEERLLAMEGNSIAGTVTDSFPLESSAEWPGFRGPNRDSIIRGIQINTDWSASPPKELWRRSIGPAWSSFAVHGDFIFTQEQRGENEVVACYQLSNGEPVWRHNETTRFWEANAGAGPRGTPSLSKGRVFSFGATGILNALNAGDGSVIWARSVSSDTNMNPPAWGFSSSPLIVDDTVIVAAVGTLAAYDTLTGEPLWVGPKGGDGYSSPHLITVDDTEQVVLLSKSGAIGVNPSDGSLLWDHKWSGKSRIVQPAVIEGGDLLISSGESSGIGRVLISKSEDGWTSEELWRTNRMKPYFSDFVIHKGHAYGFDGSNLVSMDVENGNRNWKGGRYGSGQLILLADQDLLLIISEKGELALATATPGKFTELSRFQAIEGKTWNHPVLIGNILLIRNAQEMAAFHL